MLYPPINDLLKNIENRYLLVNITARRVREMSAEAKEFGLNLSEKPIKAAINEIADGKLAGNIKKENMPNNWL